MKLNIIIGEYAMDLEVPQEYLDGAGESFERLDGEMDKGIRLGTQFIKNADATERCQYAANKLLTAIETHNEGLAMLSAGYIITRLPGGVTGVNIDNNGEPQNTAFRQG
jgi:hypothetical protein